MATLNKLSDRIDVCCTPMELRKLADKMEAHWRDLQLGESTLVETWIGNTVDVLFHLDQEKMPVRFTAKPRELWPKDLFWYGDKLYEAVATSYDEANQAFYVATQSTPTPLLIGREVNITIERSRNA